MQDYSQHNTYSPNAITELLGCYSYTCSGTSCDHVVSQQAVLTPQSSGILTKNSFGGSTLFIDHYSNFIYNLIIVTNSSECYESKKAYERVAAAYEVKVKSYHGDNLRFNANLFGGDCKSSGQTISFCGVGTHKQNAIAESKIKEVMYEARAVLLRVKRIRAKVIKTALWPCAMQLVVECYNRLSLHPDEETP